MRPPHRFEYTAAEENDNVGRPLRYFEVDGPVGVGARGACQTLASVIWRGIHEGERWT